MSGKAVAGVDNTFRRTWDKEEFAKKAEEREKREGKGDDDELTAAEIKRQKRIERDPLHQGLIVKRENLRARNYDLQLDEKLGKSQVVSAHTGLGQQAGFYCNVCDCVLKDSASWLDHINGKYHNRALGMNMQVEKVTVDAVRQKFDELKQKKEQGTGNTYTPDGFEAVIKKQQEEDERKRQEKREKKRKKKEEEQGEEEEEADLDMMALMGFGGFAAGR